MPVLVLFVLADLMMSVFPSTYSNSSPCEGFWLPLGILRVPAAITGTVI